MDNLYKILSYLISPFLRIYFYSRCLYGKDNFHDVKNHFGIPTVARPNGPLIWIHAASIGESTSALTYIKHLKKNQKNLNVLLTTITVTSAKILETKLKNFEGCIHQFVVADNPSWVKKFLDYWCPNQAIFLESEIWPNTVSELHQRKIPIFLLNARLSPRSFQRWSYFAKSFSSILKKFTGILAQSDLDFQRYKKFSSDNVFKIDNLKYVNDLLPCNDELLKQLKKFCANKKVFVAASTHFGEEEEILKSHLQLKKIFPLITIIIPRHLNRIREICSLFEKYKIQFLLRSEMNSEKFSESKNFDVILIDTFGEVGTCFRVADVTFVGGSLVHVGGHNIYEPATFGKPVLHGPHMGNAIEVRDFLSENQIAFEVKSYEDIFKYCREFFSDKKLLEDIEKNSKRITKNNSLNQIDAIMKQLNNFH